MGQKRDTPLNSLPLGCSVCLSSYPPAYLSKTCAEAPPPGWGARQLCGESGVAGDPHPQAMAGLQVRTGQGLGWEPGSNPLFSPLMPGKKPKAPGMDSRASCPVGAPTGSLREAQGSAPLPPHPCKDRAAK